MPVPKRKRSRSRRDKRFANKGIKPQSFISCLNCRQTIMPHAICKHCGYYKGVKVLVTKSERLFKRLETKQSRAARKQAREKTAVGNQATEQDQG